MTDPGGEVRGSAFDEPVTPPRDGEAWSVLRLLRWSARYLTEKGVAEGRLDAEHLLAHTLGLSRLELYLQFERPLDPDELARFKPLLLDRARRRPLQYVLGRAAFREIEVQVDERVLIPRPETEELVGAVLARCREWGRDGLSAVDVGTGSGVIALSLLVEGPFRQVVAVDRSTDAVELARENARALGLADRVEFRVGHLLDPVGEGERFHAVVANLPYVAPDELEGLEPEVRDWEPEMALVAPDHGLSLLREVVRRSPHVLHPGGLLALEVGAGQADAVARAMDGEPALGAPLILRDLARQDRIVMATNEGG
ncbi:MAG: peptide chain release factor N(5)-glutamine methyltransferase [Gemmatimonadales bacterium]|nr:MAG: peptide chain release factor N(5)-glutamine methyltransferase [Gemmatimonadales bacterium]